MNVIRPYKSFKPGQLYLCGSFALLVIRDYFTTTVNNELYLHDHTSTYRHDHTSTYSIAKAIFRNQNYNTGQLRYFDNNLSRTSKQAEIYFMNCILIK